MEKETNKTSAYLSGIGCFIFFIALVVGFIYISVHIYKTYTVQQNNETDDFGVDDDFEVDEDFDDSIEKNRRAVKKKPNISLVITNIHKMDNEDAIYQFMDKIASLSSFSKEEKNILLMEAQIRLETLQNKNKK